jgi:hypothetical protein
MTSWMETPVDDSQHVHSLSLLGLVCNYYLRIEIMCVHVRREMR